MSVELSEIKESARQVANDVGIGASEDKTWPLILDLGLLLVAVPEESSGLGLGLPGACALYSELGASVTSGPYLASMLAIEAVCRSALAEKESLLERLTSGDFATTALADSSLAVANGVLSGVAHAVPSADKAGYLLVSTANNDLVALVPRAQAGIEVTERPTWDVTRRLFDVRFKNVPVDAKLTIASGAAAAKLIRHLATHRDFALAADSIGGATALLTMTVEYLQARRQFARPLALFQALKHRCADLKMQIAAADALLLDNLGRISSVDGAALELMAEMSKQLACSTYSRVVEEALQLHGGIGMTADHKLHLFFKRALLNEHLGRGAERYELDIATALLTS